MGNLLLDRNGVVWPIAAGASNCAGKGGPSNFSRGTIPLDQGNTRGWQIEAANNGVGEAWPQAQIDSYFTVSNALNELFGNLPTDIIWPRPLHQPQDRPRRGHVGPLSVAAGLDQ